MRRTVIAAVLLVAAVACEERTRPDPPGATALAIRPAPAPAGSVPVVTPRGEPVAPIPGARSISFTARDGVDLAGMAFAPGERHGVVLAHGAGEDMASWFSFAQSLMGAGFSVVAFDFRGNGRSGGTRDPSRYPLDVEASVAYLVGAGAREVGVVGAGAGGTASVASWELDGVVGIGALGSGPVFETLDATAQARRARIDALVVALEPGDGADELARLLSGEEMLDLVGARRTDVDALVLDFLLDVVAGR